MRLKGLLGDDLEEIRRRIHMMNPVEKIKEGVNYPPFLLLQGDSDPVVNYDQTELMAKALCDHDVHTEMIRVLGGEHEGNFWSPELLDMIGDYLSRTL